MPISSTFNDVRRKLLQEDGNLQGIFEGSWDERKRTTVSQILQNPIPASFNDANHLYEHPIQAKFKKVRRLKNLHLSNESCNNVCICL
jgi:hypothetical protein